MSFYDYGNPRPFYTPQSLPLPAGVPLSDDERVLVGRLQNRFDLYTPQMLRCNAYYTGSQVVKNLGLSVPPELQSLRTLVGWGRIPVDPMVERLRVDGFRMPGQTDSDEDLQDVWRANSMDAEQSIGFTEALVMGRAYGVVSAPIEAGDVPRMSFESPLSLIASWDPKTTLARAALQSFWQGEARWASIMLPDRTIEIVQETDTSVWEVVRVDEHNFGRVPVHRMANAPRANERDGVSEITPELMSLVDSACRTLQAMEVAGQFYSVPQKIILGAVVEDFQNEDGTAKKAWDTYTSSVVALGRDEDGNTPTITQFQAYDPSVYTKVVELFASQAAALLGAPAQDLGLYTQGNPTSAEAAQVSENRRDRRSLVKQGQFAGALRGMQQDALRFMHGGVLPKDAQRLEVDWCEPQMFSLAATTDALSKQVAAGMVAPQSDVVLKKAGYSAVERVRLKQDAELDAGQMMLEQISSSLSAKAFRTNNTLTTALDATDGSGAAANAVKDAPATPAAPVPSPAVMPKRKPNVPAGK